MFTFRLRKAIAQAFPDRYNRLTWKSLLSEFLTRQMVAFLNRLAQYEKERNTNPSATYPTASETLKQAATLRAKQEGLSYERLAFFNYMLQIELAAAQRESKHYQQQAAGYEALTSDYKKLADKAINTVDNASDPKKRRN